MRDWPHTYGADDSWSDRESGEPRDSRAGDAGDQAPAGRATRGSARPAGGPSARPWRPAFLATWSVELRAIGQALRQNPLGCLSVLTVLLTCSVGTAWAVILLPPSGWSIYKSPLMAALVWTETRLLQRGMLAGYHWWERRKFGKVPDYVPTAWVREQDENQ